MLSEALIGSKDFRCDSEFFKKQYRHYEFLIKKTGYSTLNNVCYITNGSTPTYSENGIRVIRSGDLNDKWRNDDILLTSNDNNLFIIKENDILISSIGFGSIGKVDLFYGKKEKYATVSEVTILRESTINSFYLAYFLKSKFGQAFIEKNITGATGQLHLNKGSILNIPIPIFSMNLQKKIEVIVKNAYHKLNSSKISSNTSKALLLDTLGITYFSTSAENENIKSFSESFGATGRLDAEYYQAKFDELEEKIAETYPLHALGDFLTLNQRGSQPNYANEGLPVVNSKHVREGEVILSDNRFATLPDKKNLLTIKKGDVLINGTGVGTIGRSAPYLHEQEAIPDNHVTILRTNKLNPIYLSVYLNSIAGKYQVEKYFKGSSGQIELYPTDIDNFYVPIVEKPIQEKIAAAVQHSTTLKTKSTQLLDVAKRAVEIAIEQDEAAGLAYIQEQTTRQDVLAAEVHESCYSCQRIEED